MKAKKDFREGGVWGLRVWPSWALRAVYVKSWNWGKWGFIRESSKPQRWLQFPRGRLCVCTRNEKVVLKPGLTSLDTVLYQTLASGRNNQ